MIEHTQAKIDATIAAATVSAPWWLAYFDHTTHVVLAIGGIALLALRIAVAWKEWKNKKGVG